MTGLLIYLLVFRFCIRMMYLSALIKTYKNVILVYHEDNKKIRTRYILYIIFMTVFVDVAVMIDILGQSKKYGYDVQHFIRKLIYE